MAWLNIASISYFLQKQIVTVWNLVPLREIQLITTDIANA